MGFSCRPPYEQDLRLRLSVLSGVTFQSLARGTTDLLGVEHDLRVDIEHENRNVFALLCHSNQTIKCCND